MRKEGKSVGFVPTMGYLHEGHYSLIRESKKKCDVTIVSIFVNPTQFSPDEDLKRYPRDIEKDKEGLTNEKADVLFYPNTDEIYPKNFQTHVEVEEITRKLEGESRPTHFQGVTTIVAMLFNSVLPDFAFFGQKDAQQAAVIKQMTTDLKFITQIVVCPIVREPDGLALSSRNVYLNPRERDDALVISNSLETAEEMIKKGETKTEKIIHTMEDMITAVDSSDLDYISIVEADTFNDADRLKKGKEYYILIACKIGVTRLIDNKLIKI